MDPATIGVAITAANTAFNAIKRGFQAGREIESMGKDLGRWMSALSDIDNAEKSAKNASPLIKLFKGNEIEASAIEAFTAKKKLEAQRQELKTFINFHYGTNSWNEILQMEAEIRKQRRDEVYARQELIRKIWEYIGWFVLFCTVVGFIFFLHGYINKREVNMDGSVILDAWNDLSYFEGILFTIWLFILYYGKCWIDERFKK